MASFKFTPADPAIDQRLAALDQSGIFPDLVGMDPPSIAEQPLLFSPATDDPIHVACRRCGAAAGKKCRNYKGQGKFTCKERGTPEPRTETAPDHPMLPGFDGGIE
jgi:hypothetical protein